jgi:hypothetical protein
MPIREGQELEMGMLRKVADSFVPKSRTMAALMAAIIAGGVALTVGVSSASIPGGDGTIHGCYKAKSGALYVIDSTATCKGRVALNWSQGPGAADSDPIVAGHKDTANIPSNGSFANDAVMTIPSAGNYLVTVMATLANGAGSTDHIACQTLGSGVSDFDTTGANPPPGTNAPIAMQFAHTFSAGESVKLQCSDQGGLGSQSVYSIRIAAIPATTLTNTAL